MKRDTSTKGRNGTGILQYDEYMNYPLCDERIEFLSRRFLRVAHHVRHYYHHEGQNDPLDGNTVNENENPSLSWRAHVRYDSFL